MCKRRKQRNKQKTAQKRKIQEKKKRNCCQRCRRRIRIWMCRRIKRCFKRAIFGDPNPRWEEFEIAGINLGDVKDKFNCKKEEDTEMDVKKKESQKINVENKLTVITLFRNKHLKSFKIAPVKDAITDELDKYSVSKSIGKKVKSFIDDFRERNPFLGVSKDSQLNITHKEKERFSKLAKKYEKVNGSKDTEFYKSFEKLKKKLSLGPSKTFVLQNLLSDYKKGKIFINDNYKELTDIHNISKEDLNKLLARYESEKKKVNGEGKSLKKLVLELSNFSFQKLKNMKSSDLKKKFSLSGSKQITLENMIEDEKKGKLSLSAIPGDIKKVMKKLNKKNMHKMLDYYKSQKKSIHYPFVKQSKLKQLKSDLRAKIDFW